MTIGFNVGGTLGVVTPDKSLTRSSKPSLLIASFGDGYEQRAIDGINHLKETYNASFKTRPKADIDDIVTYLEGTNGVSDFDFTIPNTNSAGNEKTVKVVFVDYSINYEYDEFYSLSVNLRRVYEP